MKAPNSIQSQSHKQQMQEKAYKSRKRKRTKVCIILARLQPVFNFILL